MENKEKIEKAIGKENIIYNENMSKHTTFKTGGPAETFIKVANTKKLIELLDVIKGEKQKIYILGNGSNLIVKDEGVKGIVIKIDIKGIEIKEDNTLNKENKIKEEKVIVEIGAGEKLGTIGQKLMQNNISGFEEISGIPGTIGGAVRMNAGAHGKEIKDIIKKVKAINYKGEEKEFTKEDMQLEYRSSIFTNNQYIICEVELELNKGKKEEIKAKMDEYLNWRKEHQPLEYPSAGSTFKRGKDFITAKLIDEAGLKGYKIGGAQISTKHAGFIINKNNATSKEILELIEYTKKEVYNKYQKEIELEIEVW